ncbi:MAG: cytochrome C oxidase subunit IV family protein [candidate division NC10 bacterium]|nr:cytochrome C oxidase subunit IV family protein [candidate division NC10 bacterium]
MAHTAHTQPNYIGVFWWLLALTILEVGVIFMPIARVLIAILLVGLALTKASLVAMYFMHLKFERTTLGLIAVTPLLLCMLLVFALLPDHSATPHLTSAAAAPAAPPPSR